MTVRVFVVDDSDVFRDAVREVVAVSPDFELVGEAHSGEEALVEMARAAPDLILIDVILPGIDGLETCRQVREVHPDQFVVLCSVAEDPRLTDPDLGCQGIRFLPKARISPRALREAWDTRVVSAAS